MAGSAFEEISTITSKGQTTVPKSVRQALGLSEGDQIAFRVDETGVSVRRADDTRDDPAIAAFLTFLSKDIESNPGQLRAISLELAKHLVALTKGVIFDPDEPVEGDVDL